MSRIPKSVEHKPKAAGAIRNPEKSVVDRRLPLSINVHPGDKSCRTSTFHDNIRDVLSPNEVDKIIARELGIPEGIDEREVTRARTSTPFVQSRHQDHHLHESKPFHDPPRVLQTALNPPPLKKGPQYSLSKSEAGDCHSCETETAKVMPVFSVNNSCLSLSGGFIPRSNRLSDRHVSYSGLPLFPQIQEDSKKSKSTPLSKCSRSERSQSDDSNHGFPLFPQRFDRYPSHAPIFPHGALDSSVSAEDPLLSMTLSPLMTSPASISYDFGKFTTRLPQMLDDKRYPLFPKCTSEATRSATISRSRPRPSKDRSWGREGFLGNATSLSQKRALLSPLQQSRSGLLMFFTLYNNSEYGHYFFVLGLDPFDELDYDPSWEAIQKRSPTFIFGKDQRFTDARQSSRCNEGDQLELHVSDDLVRSRHPSTTFGRAVRFKGSIDPDDETPLVAHSAELIRSRRSKRRNNQ